MNNLEINLNTGGASFSAPVEIIPAGGDREARFERLPAGGKLSIPLAPGCWLVRVRLPGGQTLSQSVEMESRDTAITLNAVRSASAERDSWAYVGQKVRRHLRSVVKESVAKADEGEKTARRFIARTVNGVVGGLRSGVRFAAQAGKAIGNVMRRATGQSVTGTDAAAPVLIPAGDGPVETRSLPKMEPEVARPAGRTPPLWSVIQPEAGLLDATTSGLTAKILAGVFQSAAPDQAHPASGESRDPTALRLSGNAPPGTWLCVADPNGPRSSCFVLPAAPPWHQLRLLVVEDEEETARALADSPWNLAVDFGNSEAAALLAWLHRGEMEAARGAGVELLRSAVSLLEEKGQNYPAAVIAACYLVRATPPDLSAPGVSCAVPGQELIQWIANLDQRFPHPDGTVVHGWQRLRSADATKARECFLRAIQRGLPALSMVFRMLYDGLQRLSCFEEFEKDEELRRALRALAPWAASTDWEVPWTTIHAQIERTAGGGTRIVPVAAAR